MKTVFCRLFLGFLLAVTFGAVNAFACSCRAESPVCEAFGASAAIFVGEVIKGESIERFSERLSHNTQELSFVFKVKENFLGTQLKSEVAIYTGFGFGDCGFPFKKGETYLVYAYMRDGKLATNICTRSRHLTRAEEDLEALTKLRSEPNGASLTGTILRYAKSSTAEDWKQPMGGLKVRVEQVSPERKMFDILTDASGRFEVNSLPTGQYRVIPQLPVNWKVDDYTAEPFLLNYNGCATRDFFVKSVSTVSGKVTGPNREPLNGLFVDLVPVGLETKPKHLLEQTSTQNGIFTFYSVPPGEYFVAINYTSQPDQDHPFPTTFYRKNGQAGEGTTITVANGAKIEGIDIRVSSRLPMIRLTGKVLWPTGKAAKGVFVNLRDSESGQNISSVDTDIRGRFVLNGFAGRKYTLETYIENYASGERYDAKDVEFVLSPTTITRPFRLILKRSTED